MLTWSENSKQLSIKAHPQWRRVGIRPELSKWIAIEMYIAVAIRLLNSGRIPIRFRYCPDLSKRNLCHPSILNSFWFGSQTEPTRTCPSPHLWLSESYVPGHLDFFLPTPQILSCPSILNQKLCFHTWFCIFSKNSCVAVSDVKLNTFNKPLSQQSVGENLFSSVFLLLFHSGITHGVSVTVSIWSLAVVSVDRWVLSSPKMKRSHCWQK